MRGYKGQSMDIHFLEKNFVNYAPKLEIVELFIFLGIWNIKEGKQCT